MTTQADLDAYFAQLQNLSRTGEVFMGAANIPMRYTALGLMPDPEWVRMTSDLDTRPAGDGYHPNPTNWANEIQRAGGALTLNQAQQQRGYPGITQGPGMPAPPIPPRGMGPGMVGNPNYTTTPGPAPAPYVPPGGTPPANPPNPGGNPPGNPPGGVTPPNPVAPGLLGTAPRQWTGSPWQAGPNSPFSGSFFPAFGVQGVANYRYPAQPGGTVTRTPGSGGLQPTGTNPGSSPPGGNPPSPDPVNGSLQSLNTTTPNTSYTPRNLVNYAAGGVQLPYRNQFEQYTQSLAMAQPWTPTYNGRGQSGTPLRGQPSWQQGGGQQGGGMNLGAMLAGLLGGRNG